MAPTKEKIKRKHELVRKELEKVTAELALARAIIGDNLATVGIVVKPEDVTQVATWAEHPQAVRDLMADGRHDHRCLSCGAMPFHEEYREDCRRLAALRQLRDDRATRHEQFKVERIQRGPGAFRREYFGTFPISERLEQDLEQVWRGRHVTSIEPLAFEGLDVEHDNMMRPGTWRMIQREDRRVLRIGTAALHALFQSLERNGRFVEVQPLTQAERRRAEMRARNAPLRQAYEEARQRWGPSPAEQIRGDQRALSIIDEMSDFPGTNR